MAIGNLLIKKATIVTSCHLRNSDFCGSPGKRSTYIYFYFLNGITTNNQTNYHSPSIDVVLDIAEL